MSATTPRFNIQFPTADDLVSGFTEDVRAMCNTIDTALAEVDDRNNTGGVKPIVRNTLAQLQAASAVTGQTGQVTDDGFNTGTWHFNGNQWVKVQEQATEWQAFQFEMQSESSFVPLQYSTNRLLWNPALRLIKIELMPFKSNVTVNSYGVYVASGSTLRPSANVNLGQALWDSGGRGCELTLNISGNVSVGPLVSNGDIIKPYPSIVPVPSNVTITAANGSTI